MSDRRMGRLHLRIAPDLKREVEEYARRNHTTLSELVTRFFVRVLQAEREKQQPPDAEQV